jgi:probable rRNA maturation factor
MLVKHRSSTSMETFMETVCSILKEKILGKKYSLSLVFSDPTTIQKLNVTYRDKDYVPNVLSFPLSKTSGEIYICPSVAKKEAAEYDHTPAEHLRYLYIHGCLHLKGLPHGKEMDRLEKKYMTL